MPRSIRLLVAVAWLLTGPAARAAMLPDSTVRESWRLANGLEVRTLRVPNAAGVSVTVAYRAGSGYEPAALEGLSGLLAEVQWMSAAGGTPERTRDEMASVRPLGWECRPGTRLVRFTEIVTTQQLPGVLQDAARRMGGVTVTDADVRNAFVNVRRDLGQRYFGQVSDVLYWRVSAIARGLDDEGIVRYAGLRGLERLAVRDVTPWLQRWYHTGNASLAIAGNLEGLDVHALVQTLFGPLAAGPVLPDTVEVRFHGARHMATWKGLREPVGALAVTSPSLADTLHPSFYLGMLITGPALIGSWGPAADPLTSRFQYSLLDEPELVRFYPPVRADATDPDLLAGALYEQLMVVGGQNVMGSLLTRVKRSVRWLLGGELAPELRERLRTDVSGLGTLSSGMAARAVWKGDAFWTAYLARFDASTLGHNYFYEWLTTAEHQSRLLLVPAN